MLRVSPAVYSKMVPMLEIEAFKHGYAIGLHGSMQRDLDIIAFPWIEESSSCLDLLNGVICTVGGTLVGRPFPKSHNRIGFCIGLSNNRIKSYIDFSVFLKLGDNSLCL